MGGLPVYQQLKSWDPTNSGWSSEELTLGPGLDGGRTRSSCRKRGIVNLLVLIPFSVSEPNQKYVGSSHLRWRPRTHGISQGKHAKNREPKRRILLLFSLGACRRAPGSQA